MSAEIRELIKRRRRQYLVHSFLYYRCDESLIPDSEYDRIVRELIDLQRQHPQIAETVEFHDLCHDLDGSMSGYAIPHYPFEIVSVALRLLAYRNRVPFETLARKYKYSVIGGETKRG